MHQVAQGIAPDARVVYVDYDPVVLAHAHSLLKSSSQGATAYLQADLRDVELVLAEAAATLDLGVVTYVILSGPRPPAEDHQATPLTHTVGQTRPRPSSPCRAPPTVGGHSPVDDRIGGADRRVAVARSNGNMDGSRRYGYARRWVEVRADEVACGPILLINWGPADV